ncbi:urease accessory protein UreE [Sphingobacterium shayense]|uniref:urease accessory protein UreE n=1 Tax=Sphingobacterium shayense TaxID=626343 RepID=UPI001553C768|nr:urease accessory protein UreE [Sphingobacterium shayense]NQD71742.1 urease accessory protein UreE [Sphingobacterium shayense]
MILIEEIHRSVASRDNLQDFLELEWYEVNKTLIKRYSKLGESIHIQLAEKVTYYQGQIIYQDDNRTVRVLIKPCLSIVLKSENIRTVGKFCFDVGNRHLPIFQLTENQIAVSYDARLYQALQGKYKDEVRLEEVELLPEMALKAFGNFM